MLLSRFNTRNNFHPSNNSFFCVMSFRSWNYSYSWWSLVSLCPRALVFLFLASYFWNPSQRSPCAAASQGLKVLRRTNGCFCCSPRRHQLLCRVWWKHYGLKWQKIACCLVPLAAGVKLTWLGTKWILWTAASLWKDALQAITMCFRSIPQERCTSETHDNNSNDKTSSVSE